MRRALALLVPLALVLVAASLAGATTAQSIQGEGSPLVAAHGNTTNYLTVPAEDVQATDYASVGLDVGLDVATDGRNLQITQELRAFHDRFDAAETDENKTAAYNATITSLDDRTDELYAHTNGITASYAQDSVEAETLLRERAAVGAEAARLQEAVDELQGVARDDLAYDLPNEADGRLSDVDSRLAILQGPVSDRTARLASGGGGSQSVYAESSSTGYTFATMEDDTYVRETYLSEEYDPTASDQFADAEGNRIEGVLQRATELYPTTNLEGVSGSGSTGIYQYNAEFEEGPVTVYFDGGTTNPFRESQQVDAPSLPTADVAETTNGTVTLRVNRTFPTGPMEVSLFDRETNTSVAGDVTVNGHPVGETNDEGRLWAVEPREDVTVEATTTDANLTLSPDGA